MGEKERSVSTAEDPGVVGDLRQPPSGAQAASGATHEDDWHDQARVAPADVDGDGAEDSIESTPGGVGRQTPKRDFGDKMQPGGGGGGQQGIAIGDPGVNGNIAPDPPAAAINNSHSNIKNMLEVDPGDGDADGDSAPGGVERQTPKRDFGDRMAAGGNVETDPGGGEPTPAESAIVKSKSNITNNRTD